MRLFRRFLNVLFYPFRIFQSLTKFLLSVSVEALSHTLCLRIAFDSKPIIVHDRIQTMSDSQYGAIFELSANCFLNQIVSLHIDGGRRLIEH